MTDIAPQETEKPYKSKCKELPAAPPVPKIPERGSCPQPCKCPTPPGGTPSSCFDDLIRDQSIVVKKADRAKAFVDELTAIQGKVTSAQVDFTQARFKDLRKTWKDQDKAIAELIRKLVCAVPCWECLLACRLCTQLVDIRALEDRLKGTGVLTKDVYSLPDLQAWHQHNVADMQARVDRIKLVLAAWENPSSTLGDVLDKNGKLIEDTQNIIATDPAKAVYDVFMTLLPRHWAIRPRDEGKAKDESHVKEWASEIDSQYIKFCQCKESQPKADEKSQQKDKDKDECDGSAPKPEVCRCDDGTPDDCCGPDVGVLSLRQRLVGPLPYIEDPSLFPEIICCLTKERLSPASELLATAQANLDATSAEIELVTKRIADKTNAIEATFRAELINPIDCSQYESKDQSKQDSPPSRPPEDNSGGYEQTDRTAN
jgi:hypothetical protein